MGHKSSSNSSCCPNPYSSSSSCHKCSSSSSSTCNCKSFTSWSDCKKCGSSSSSSKSFSSCSSSICSCEKRWDYKTKCCLDNPYYNLTNAQIELLNNLNRQNVGPNTSSPGNVLSQGYGIIPGVPTRNIYNV